MNLMQDLSGAYSWVDGFPAHVGVAEGLADFIEPHDVPANTEIWVPGGKATALADFDVETFSAAGFEWNDEAGKFYGLGRADAKKAGLSLVGTAAYAEHPSTEVLMMAYNLKDGLGERMWLPGMPQPVDLIEHILAGKLLEAHNCLFEWFVWEYVFHRRMGWPRLPFWILRDSIEKCRASAYPAALGKVGKVLELSNAKLETGKDYIKKYSMPQNPNTKARDLTKRQPFTKLLLPAHNDDSLGFQNYNRWDIRAECEVSLRVPDLQPEEQLFALATRAMNVKGIQIDVEAMHNAISILDQAYALGVESIQKLTDGYVDTFDKPAKIIDWLYTTHGIKAETLDLNVVDSLLEQNLPASARNVLLLRKSLSSAGVKKLYAMRMMLSQDGRLRNLFIYHGARTGRDTGADVQPQNLVKAGSKMRKCGDMTCQKWYAPKLETCPHCGVGNEYSDLRKWDHAATDAVIEDLKETNVYKFTSRYHDPVKAISGIVRGLFIAAPGHDLICSDYSSIEAVVQAVLAGEQWRINAFQNNEDIYLLACEGITGIPYKDYLAHYQETGSKHEDRAAIGKFAELACGFGGWVNGWRGFDTSSRFTDEELKEIIMKWRDASPAIVEMWGGQCRGKPWRPTHYELYGLEGAAISAIQNPGQAFSYRLITYMVQGDKLFCRLPSGRMLTYHEPRLSPSDRWDNQVSISFMGWNSNPKMGPKGWMRIDTYGGRLFENVVQATARDIMAFANLNLERAGYPIVLRVHDELAAEVPHGFGSIEEFERMMATLPDWARGWPIKASGGWRGYRFRKD